MTKAGFIYFLKAAIFSGCFLVYGCQNKMEDVQALATKRISQETAEGVESYMSQNGKVKAKLTAPEMVRIEKDTAVIEFPKTLKVLFYNDSLQPESHLFAKYGRYLENQGKILLKDSVIVFNVKGDTLFTSELWWYRDEEIFTTDKHVEIHQPFGQIMVGKSGMKADQSFKSWELYNASGIKNVADSTLPE